MKSKILDAVHKTATGLHKSGTIADVTMREFDKLCLKPVHVLQPAQIKSLREKARKLGADSIFRYVLHEYRSLPLSAAEDSLQTAVG